MGSQHTVQFRKHLGWVHHVLEDHVRNDRIKARIFERELRIGASRESLVVRHFVEVGPENFNAVPASPQDASGVAAAEVKNARCASGVASPVEHESSIDMQAVLVVSGLSGHGGSDYRKWNAVEGSVRPN